MRCGAGAIVCAKGPGKFAAQWALKKLGQVGLRDIKIRTESEHSIVELAQEVKKLRVRKSLLEVAPEADHEAIGGVECLHRVIQDWPKFQVEKNLSVALRTRMATTTWLVRHTNCIIFRFAMNKNFKTAKHFRLHGKNYSSTMVNLYEAVLAPKPEDVSAGRKTSKWDSRWRVGNVDWQN